LCSPHFGLQLFSLAKKPPQRSLPHFGSQPQVGAAAQVGSTPQTGAAQVGSTPHFGSQPHLLWHFDLPQRSLWQRSLWHFGSQPQTGVGAAQVGSQPQPPPIVMRLSSSNALALDALRQNNPIANMAGNKIRDLMWRAPSSGYTQVTHHGFLARQPAPWQFALSVAQGCQPAKHSATLIAEVMVWYRRPVAPVFTER
jgi:hypothetical protein